MSADIKLLRTRIKSVDSTLHLTKAMGLVASSKIRKATDAMNRGRAYADSLEETVLALSTFEKCKNNPYFEEKEEGCTRLVVIAGDRGLAGGYNANIFRLAKDFSAAEMIPIGKRASEWMGKPIELVENYPYSRAIEIAKSACEDFLQKKIDRFGIVCTKYHSMMSQEAYVKWVLPLRRGKAGSAKSAVFEPNEIEVLDVLVPQYVAGQILVSVKESFASEVAARRVAMDNAGKNAQEMIDRLSLEYNRARQGAITQEITEIVAGSGE